MSKLTVVVNDRGQYSVWACDRALPPGWSATGVEGTTEQCLNYIESVWADVLPADARRETTRDTEVGPAAKRPACATTVGWAVGVDHV